MATPLALTAILFVAIALVLLIVLAMRRVILARRARLHAAAVRRVRPFAIMLLAGEQTVLADVLGRYARQLTGAAEGRVAEYFQGTDALARSQRELGSRRAWKRASAAYRLGDMGREEVAPALLAALDDSNRTVRAAAARSL